MTKRSKVRGSRIVHRIAVLIVFLTWPLIWVGGLVTTQDAGMAVPDWPSTYGYNLFLYPYKTWLLGPFDLFIEHGHRLLGALVGFASIGLVVAAWQRESRVWVRWWAALILASVIFQGTLGGVRVRLGDRTFAMLHGSTAPIVFALTVVGAVITSRWWFRHFRSEERETSEEELPEELRPDVSEQPMATVPGLVSIGVLVATCYLQLVLGARLRHLQPDGSPTGFLHTATTHVVLAFILFAITVVVWRRLRRCGDLTLSRPGASLIGLLGIQILLGIGTWVVNYGWPSFLNWFPGASGYVVRAKDFTDGVLVTAHVATGSLILAVSVFVLVRILRVRFIHHPNAPHVD